MDNAIIIGKGMVGQATAHALGIKDYVSRYSWTIGTADISRFKYIYICLPTPTIRGKCFTGIIEDYIKLVAKDKKDNIFIIRSTVEVGTCRKLTEKYNVKIVHVPEFLTESTWKQDAEWPDVVIVGGDDEKSRVEVMGIFKARYKGATFLETDTVTSETIKYAVNTFYALKVVFANSIFDFCQEKGINYETVKKALFARKWVGQAHLTIWHDGGRGAGPPCLEKDLESFANLSKLPLLKLANELNKKLLKKYPKNETKDKTQEKVAIS